MTDGFKVPRGQLVWHNTSTFKAKQPWHINRSELVQHKVPDAMSTRLACLHQNHRFAGAKILQRDKSGWRTRNMQ
eukprot:3666089-Rhodomonas_salina.1